MQTNGNTKQLDSVHSNLYMERNICHSALLGFIYMFYMLPIASYQLLQFYELNTALERIELSFSDSKSDMLPLHHSA